MFSRFGKFLIAVMFAFLFAGAALVVVSAQDGTPPPVQEETSACTTCHDSHGVAGAPHLINFNTDYVTPASNGRLDYISTGLQRGVCTLTCHGKEHKLTAY